MKLLFLGILLSTLSQASWANFNCEAQGHSIDVTHNGSEASVEYQFQGHSAQLVGQWAVERDFLYTTYNYTLNDSEGKPANLIVTKQKLMGRGGSIPGGSCRSRAGCAPKPIYYTYAKLNLNQEELVLECF